MGVFRFVVPFILLSIAAVLLTQGYQHWRASKQLLDSSLTTEGTVIRNAPYMSSKAGKSTSLVYFPQVKFTTKDGKTVEFISKVTSRAEQYKPGDLVRVLYRENKPEEAFIGSFKRCQPWRAKRRLVDPSSREAALFSRRALRQRENKVGLRTRRPVIWEPSTEQQRACEVVA